tara:strand:- start:3232 stop:4362 length:1131 start_codon:yes stop_codon:yes gene_type:complete
MSALKHVIKFCLFGLLLILISCKDKYPNLKDGIYAKIVTSKGIMVARLDYKKAPNTVANFISLAEGTNTLVDSLYKGKKFYDGTIFHRVINGFMIQGGDPTGTGSGNPGYRFDDEFNSDLKHDKPGVLGMANSGPNTNGSQFYITDVPKPNLDNVYTVFGELVIGLNVLDSISKVNTSGPEHRPDVNVVLEEVNIFRKGLEANAFDAPSVFINHFAELERLEKKRKEQEESILKLTKKKFEMQQQHAVLLPSGLHYLITEKGNGKKLTETSKILMHYAVYFENGKLIETSEQNIAEGAKALNEERKLNNDYQPIKANLSPNAKMISGLKEGLQQLSVGDKATLFIPFYLAYGEAGNKIIPPDSNLIFEVEVLENTK